jgi:hypothetical protein
MKKIIFVTMASLMILIACDDQFEETNINPNQPSQSIPSLVFNGIVMDVFYLGEHFRPFTDRLVPAQYMVSSDDFYGTNSYDFDSHDFSFFVTLANTEQLVKEAQRMNNDAYVTLAKTFKAFLFFDISRRVGDIPCSEALRSAEGLYEPKYDTQQQVVLQCLSWLEEANEEYKNLQSTIEKDLIYDGDLRNWQKFNNAIRLRILIELSKHADDAALNVKSKFAAIVNNPQDHPLFADFQENAKLTFYENMANKYPFYLHRDQPRSRVYYMAQNFMELLTKKHDPRVFALAEPTDSAKNSGNPNYETDFNAYNGILFGLATMDIADIVRNEEVSKRQGSRMHARYESYTGEPYIVVGYPEVSFCIAEAINRGWISGDAATYYKNGITGSMKFYGIGDAEINAYLSQPEITYAGNNQDGLQQILEQKYVSLFNNSSYEPFFNQRRTGIPIFTTGPGTFNDGKVPKRWAYPRGEYDNNAANLEEALKRQFGGSDDRNDIMWLIQ